MFIPSRKKIFTEHAKDNLLRIIIAITLLAALILHSGCAGTPDRFYIPKGDSPFIPGRFESNLQSRRVCGY